MATKSIQINRLRSCLTMSTDTEENNGNIIEAIQ